MPFHSNDDMARRSGLNQQQLTVLPSADALTSLSGIAVDRSGRPRR